MKRTLLFVSLFFLFLLVVPTVHAWGVLPARQLASYENGVQDFTFTLRNSGLEEGYFQVSFGGELAKFGSYTGPETIFFSATTPEQDIPISLNLDTSQLEPGRNRLRVVFRQVSGQSSATVGAAVTLVGELVVDVPYTGEFVDATLFTKRSPVDEPTPFELSLINKGESSVNVYADMRVLGPTNQVIATWQTPSFILGYQQADKIRTQWSGEKEPGTYSVEAVVHYGEKTTVLRDTFIVGSKEVEILSLDSERFRLGQINELSFQARSTWNDILEDVYAEIFVVDGDGRVLQSFKTNPSTFRAFQTLNLQGFWNTQNLEVGRYTLNIITHVGADTSQYSFPVVVALDQLNLAGNVVATQEEEGNINSLIVILLVVVLITNVVLILYFRRQKKK